MAALGFYSVGEGWESQARFGWSCDPSPLQVSWRGGEGEELASVPQPTSPFSLQADRGWGGEGEEVWGRHGEGCYQVSAGNKVEKQGTADRGLTKV